MGDRTHCCNISGGWEPRTCFQESLRVKIPTHIRSDTCKIPSLSGQERGEKFDLSLSKYISIDKVSTGTSHKKKNCQVRRKTLLGRDLAETFDLCYPLDHTTPL